MAKIIIDTNAGEHFLFEPCVHEGIIVERRLLHVGDIIISTSTIDYVIERKTWADLAASICDGRWSEQKSRMAAADNSESHMKPCKYAYIIEGPLDGWTRNGGASRMNPASMWGAILKTQIRDGMHVFHTKDKLCTIKLVLYLHKQFSTESFNMIIPMTIPGLNNVKRKRDNLTTRPALLVAMLSVIPGMSKGKATTIVELYPSLKSLAAAEVDALSQVQCGGRCLGPVLARRIHALSD